MLPIVQRELQVAARNPRLYTWRTRTGLAVTALAALILVSGPNSSPAGALFRALSFLALILCLLEGVRKTADAITIERREGTLGLLFLSTLSGLDIVMGKLAAAAIRSLGPLLAFVPILAVSLLLGGTTAGEFWRTILVLMLTLTMSLCVCLSFSVISRERSVGVSLGFLAFLAVVPFLISVMMGRAGPGWVLPVSPVYLLSAASDAYYSFSPRPFWLGVAWLSALAAVSIAAASGALPRRWQDAPRLERRKHAMRRGGSALAENERQLMLDRNAIMWLMFDPQGHRTFRSVMIGICAVVVLTTAALIYAAPEFGLVLRRGTELLPATLGLAAVVLVASLQVARETSRNFAEARENGAMELILSTPVKVGYILKGQWLAIQKDMRPALIVFLSLGALVTFGSVLFSNGRFEAIFVVKAMLEAALGVVTVGSVGMWMGLTSKTPTRALFKTVFIGLILPHIICTPTLVNQVTVLLLAADKVNVHFRRFVAERYLPSVLPSLSAVGASKSDSPPVLR